LEQIFGKQADRSRRVLFDGAGYASFIDIGHRGVTEGNDDALARQPLGVAVGLDKLNKGGT